MYYSLQPPVLDGHLKLVSLHFHTIHFPKTQESLELCWSSNMHIDDNWKSWNKNKIVLKSGGKYESNCYLKKYTRDESEFWNQRDCHVWFFSKDLMTGCFGRKWMTELIQPLGLPCLTQWEKSKCIWKGGHLLILRIQHFRFCYELFPFTSIFKMWLQKN